MYKSIELDIYENGFSLESLNCIDIPIAAIAGYYGMDNYYHYCFYLSVLKCWMLNYDTVDCLDFRNMILGKMGLAMKGYNLKSSSELISLIKMKIDQQIPVLMLPAYSSLFYDRNYLYDTSNFPHGIIVSEYDSDRSVLIIREPLLISFHNNFIENKYIHKKYKGYSMYKFQITESMIADIWEKSSQFLKENTWYHNKVFCIERISERKIDNSVEVIGDLLHNYKLSSDRILKLLEDYKTLKDDESIINYQKRFVKSLEVVFGYIEHTLKITYQNPDLSCKYLYELKKQFIEYRTYIIRKLYSCALKNKDLESKDSDKLKSEILTNEEKFFSYLNKLYIDMKDCL